MNKHIEKAMSIRNENPMVSNCAQTILRAYAEELGITGDMAAKLSSNFGGGMKCGLTCGAITGELMVLGKCPKGWNQKSALRWHDSRGYRAYR